MSRDEEQRHLEGLLRRRGTDFPGDPAVEREILERYQDDCAVLVLDSCGFTRLTQKHGIIHFLALVVAMHDICRRALQAHHNYGTWTEGDNLYATFPTARDALLCALQIRDSIAEANRDRSPAERLEVAIGIGAGRMLRIGRANAFGNPMNLASKLGEDIAGAGEILLTDDALHDVGELPAGVEAIPRTRRVSGVEISFVSIVPVEAS